MGVVVRKELLRPGTYWTRRGPVTFSPADVAAQVRGGNEMLRRGLAIPCPLEHQEDTFPLSHAERLAQSVLCNAGWVRGYGMDPDGSSWVDFEVEPDPDVCRKFGVTASDLEAKLKTTIKYVSPQIHPTFIDGSGREWKNVVTHVALTPQPVWAQQKPFGGDGASLLSLGEVPEWSSSWASGPVRLSLVDCWQLGWTQAQGYKGKLGAKWIGDGSDAGQTRYQPNKPGPRAKKAPAAPATPAPAAPKAKAKVVAKPAAAAKPGGKAKKLAATAPAVPGHKAGAAKRAAAVKASQAQTEKDVREAFKAGLHQEDILAAAGRMTREQLVSLMTSSTRAATWKGHLATAGMKLKKSASKPELLKGLAAILKGDGYPSRGVAPATTAPAPAAPSVSVAATAPQPAGGGWGAISAPGAPAPSASPIAPVKPAPGPSLRSKLVAAPAGKVDLKDTKGERASVVSYLHDPDKDQTYFEHPATGKLYWVDPQTRVAYLVHKNGDVDTNPDNALGLDSKAYRDPNDVPGVMKSLINPNAEPGEAGYDPPPPPPPPPPPGLLARIGKAGLKALAGVGRAATGIANVATGAIVDPYRLKASQKKFNTALIGAIKQQVAQRTPGQFGGSHGTKIDLPNGWGPWNAFSKTALTINPNNVRTLAVDQDGRLRLSPHGHGTTQYILPDDFLAKLGEKYDIPEYHDHDALVGELARKGRVPAAVLAAYPHHKVAHTLSLLASAQLSLADQYALPWQLGWTAAGQSRGGKTKWKGTEEHQGQTRYQEKMPGTRGKAKPGAAPSPSVTAATPSAAKTPGEPMPSEANEFELNQPDELQTESKPVEAVALNPIVQKKLFDTIGKYHTDIGQLRGQLAKELPGKAFDQAIINLAEQRKLVVSQDSHTEGLGPEYIHDGKNVYTTVALANAPTGQPTPAVPPAAASDEAEPEAPHPAQQLVDQAHALLARLQAKASQPDTKAELNEFASLLNTLTTHVKEMTAKQQKLTAPAAKAPRVKAAPKAKAASAPKATKPAAAAPSDLAPHVDELKQMHAGAAAGKMTKDAVNATVAKLAKLKAPQVQAIGKAMGLKGAAIKSKGAVMLALRDKATVAMPQAKGESSAAEPAKTVAVAPAEEPKSVPAKSAAKEEAEKGVEDNVASHVKEVYEKSSKLSDKEINRRLEGLEGLKPGQLHGILSSMGMRPTGKSGKLLAEQIRNTITARRGASLRSESNGGGRENEAASKQRREAAEAENEGKGKTLPIGKSTTTPTPNPAAKEEAGKGAEPTAGKLPAEKAHKAIGDAYNHLKLFKEFEDGLVEIPRLWHEAKKRDPGLTQEQFKSHLKDLSKHAGLELHSMNEVHTRTPEQRQEAISENDRLKYYVIPKKGKDFPDLPEQMQDKPDTNAPKPATKKRTGEQFSSRSTTQDIYYRLSRGADMANKPTDDDDLFADVPENDEPDGDETPEAAPAEPNGGDDIEAKLQRASECLAEKGIMVDPSHDISDFIDHLITACETHSATNAMADEENNPAMTEPPQEETMPVTMSLRMQALEADLARERALKVGAEVKGLIKTGQATPAQANKWLGVISAQRLSLVGGKEDIKLASVMAQIEHAKELPQGTFWTSEQKAVRLSSLNVEQPPDGLFGEDEDTTPDAAVMSKLTGGRWKPPSKKEAK